MIRVAKSKYWYNFCSSINESTTCSEMWQKMRWIKGYRTPRPSVDIDSADKLLHSLTPDFVPPPKPVFSSNNPKLELEISMQELVKCIKLKDTSPGFDDITYSMIKHLPENGKAVLLTLYNKFLTDGFVPKQWRDICIIPIPKPGREMGSVSSLRPISLISCVCKILHSILNSRLEWFMERSKVFSNNTIGLGKSRSCLDNLSCLVSRIQTGFSRGDPRYMYIYGIF